MNIGNLIQTQRRKNKLTQNALGNLLGVSNTTISNYENGISSPDLNTFIILSRILNIAYTPLIAFSENHMDNYSIFEKVYSSFYNITKDIPESRITVTNAKHEWKCRTISPESIVVIDEKPESFRDYDLVCASVPKGEEHIYTIRFYKSNTYLVPENGPPYLCTVRISPDTPLKRILAIIRYPSL